jgi:hypothetical protein
MNDFYNGSEEFCDSKVSWVIHVYSVVHLKCDLACEWSHSRRHDLIYAHQPATGLKRNKCDRQLEQFV